MRDRFTIVNTGDGQNSPNGQATLKVNENKGKDSGTENFKHDETLAHGYIIWNRKTITIYNDCLVF